MTHKNDLHVTLGKMQYGIDDRMKMKKTLK